MMRWLLALLLFWSTASFAVGPDEILADPALEARARTISKELRCLVCQNQSIDDSEADLAKDLRRVVRERLKAGDSDQQVVDYMVARYGNFVRMTPPFEADTIPLWFGPFWVLAIGGGLIYVTWRRARRLRPADAPLTPEEEEKLKAALGDPGTD
jgi:cytochrome c-type biogenesis protein CcmH